MPRTAWQDAIQGTVAAAVAMVPDGLVLLTSLAFVAGVLQLTKRNALAKQLSTVEVLARVDVLCLDKTGTITTGAIRYTRSPPAPDSPAPRTSGRSCQDRRCRREHPTQRWRRSSAGLSEVVVSTDWQVDSIEPFSSARKWSAVSFVDHGWFYLGAPDFLIAVDDRRGHELISARSDAGMRLLALVSSDGGAGRPGPAMRCRRSRRRSRSSNSRTRSVPTPPRSSPTSPARTSR